MKGESIAECSTFDLHKPIIGLENQVLDVFLSGRLRLFFSIFNLILEEQCS